MFIYFLILASFAVSQQPQPCSFKDVSGYCVPSGFDSCNYFVTDLPDCIIDGQQVSYVQLNSY
jgi:hypothetical protein